MKFSGIEIGLEELLKPGARDLIWPLVPGLVVVFGSQRHFDWQVFRFAGDSVLGQSIFAIGVLLFACVSGVFFYNIVSGTLVLIATAVVSGLYLSWHAHAQVREPWEEPVFRRVVRAKWGHFLAPPKYPIEEDQDALTPSVRAREAFKLFDKERRERARQAFTEIEQLAEEAQHGDGVPAQRLLPIVNRQLADLQRLNEHLRGLSAEEEWKDIYWVLHTKYPSGDRYARTLDSAGGVLATSLALLTVHYYQPVLAGPATVAAWIALAASLVTIALVVWVEVNHHYDQSRVVAEILKDKHVGWPESLAEERLEDASGSL